MIRRLLITAYILSIASPALAQNAAPSDLELQAAYDICMKAVQTMGPTSKGLHYADADMAASCPDIKAAYAASSTAKAAKDAADKAKVKTIHDLLKK